MGAKCKMSLRYLLQNVDDYGLVWVCYYACHSIWNAFVCLPIEWMIKSYVDVHDRVRDVGDVNQSSSWATIALLDTRDEYLWQVHLIGQIYVAYFLFLVRLQVYFFFI